MLLDKEVYIFSVEKSSYTKEQAKFETEQFKKQLDKRDISYKQAKGAYNGIPERSFIVPVVEMTGKLLKDIFNYHSQDCILRVLPNGSAYLEYPDKAERIGKLQKVAISRALRYKSYTIVDDTAYIVN